MSYLRNILLLFLVFNVSGTIMAQDSYKVSIKFKKMVLVNNEFKSILDSLLKKEQKCKDYDETLFWSVYFIDLKNDEYAIDITLFSEFNAESSDQTDETIGYFEIENTPFIVSGTSLPNGFFTECGGEKVFTSKNSEIPYPEDYSTWMYGYKNNTLFLREEYPLPCE